MNKILSLLLCALLLFGCTKETEITDSNSMQVSFTSDITTRVSTTGFEPNDIISVAAYSGTSAIATNTAYTYDGLIFSSDTPIEYETSDQELTFTAVYPAMEGSIMSFDFVVATDQRVEDAYELSDLLTSTTSPTTERQPELSFYHRLSSIIINIISSEDFSNGVLTFNSMNNASCDLSEATFEAKGDATTIYAAENSNTGYKAIIAPQTISANSEFATFTLGDEVYTWTLIEDLVLSTGRQYVYNWDVVTNKVTLSGVLNDWGESDAEDTGSDISYTRLSDYSATSYPTDTDEWFIYDMYTTYSDFAGLRDALNAISVYSPNRDISIGFTNITAVPSSAFYESSHSMNSLTRLSLPYVTRINYRAFYGCTSLETLSTPELVYVGEDSFYGCTSLNSITMSKVVSIDAQAFYNCTSFNPLTLPQAKTISSSAFYNCTSIETLVADSLDTVVGTYTSAYGTFRNMTKLKSITLPSITYLPSVYSYSSSTLTSSYACFYNCTSLQEVNIPNVYYVGGQTFTNCSTLQTISIPKATQILYYAFYGCTNLMNLTIATESILTLFSYSFDSQDTRVMTLTIGSANSHLVDGNVFKAPNGSGGYVEYTFKEIILVD